MHCESEALLTVLFRSDLICNLIVSEQVRVSVFAFLFYKGNEKPVPRALLSYISTWEFLRTLEKCEKHEPHFSRVLKNSTMH